MLVKIEELVKEFDASTVIESKKITWHGVEGYDVYNITKPFIDNEITLIAGRVEKRDSEISKIMFFKQISDDNYQLTDLPTFDLQDPYFTYINGELVLGGTEIFAHPQDATKLWYKAVKYVGKDIKSLKRFFEGPNGMKDIRLLQLEDNKILVFTRPQGEVGGRGQIGRVIIDNLADLTIDVINTAPLFNCFTKDNWGGVNEAVLLKDQNVGVLGHIASFDELGNRHYYACTFIYDIKTDSCSEFKILVKRENLRKGESKRPDLEDVIFAGGIKIESEFAEVHLGAGDCEGHVVKVINPFLGREVI